MASRFRDKMTYANVASTAALVIAVAGGGAATAAALIPNNSVNSAKIVNNSVKSIDVKNDNLNGTDINEGSLGQVPSANTANSATNADTTRPPPTSRTLSCSARSTTTRSLRAGRGGEGLRVDRQRQPRL